LAIEVPIAHDSTTGNAAARHRPIAKATAHVGDPTARHAATVRLAMPTKAQGVIGPMVRRASMVLAARDRPKGLAVRLIRPAMRPALRGRRPSDPINRPTGPTPIRPFELSR
jgi:hypothetical protein